MTWQSKGMGGIKNRRKRRMSAALGLWVVFFALVFVTTGCKTSSPDAALLSETVAKASVRVNPGDVVDLRFPGAPAMNVMERVRLDGNLFLPLIGEVAAAGKSPAQLQTELSALYAKHLQVKEVVVILASTSASVFVSGAVNRPGRVPMERPMTVLDAIMEAGGFDPKRANVKRVAIIRNKEGRYTRNELNLRPVLKGENVVPFNLEPFDIVFVPEKLF